MAPGAATELADVEAEAEAAAEAAEAEAAEEGSADEPADEEPAGVSGGGTDDSLAAAARSAALAWTEAAGLACPG